MAIKQVLDNNDDEYITVESVLLLWSRRANVPGSILVAAEKLLNAIPYKTISWCLGLNT
jgi:hypothetical protein